VISEARSVQNIMNCEYRLKFLQIIEEGASFLRHGLDCAEAVVWRTPLWHWRYHHHHHHWRSSSTTTQCGHSCSQQSKLSFHTIA